jgi:polyvinyl alcohol dehydrogenase (cytochrome)
LVAPVAAVLALAACSAASTSPGGAPGPTTTGPATTGPAVTPSAGGITTAVASTGRKKPTASAGAKKTGSAAGADWPEYNADPARTGIAVGLAAAGPLSTAWTAHLDGAVYGQPLLVGNEVIAATENDSVYALSRATGQVTWHAKVGTPVPVSALACGNIDPLGITGTPVYDAGTGLVYAVAEVTGFHHLLVALDAATGAVKLSRDLDTPTSSNQPANDQQRPGLAIEGGRVYAAFGGLYGDCGAYQGSVVSAPLTGNGPLAQWVTPTSREGAIWGTGGPVTGPDGNLWVSIGNGAAESGVYDGSDSVTELSPALQRVGYFAPTGWADDNAQDLDLGSTQPVLAAGNAVFVMGKRGTGYLLSGTNPGGIGGQLAQRDICDAEGAAAVDGGTIYEPCQDGGMAAIAVSAANKTIKVLWRGPGDAAGSPVLGGGAVWVTAYSGNGGGTLYELNPATGAVEHQIAIGDPLPHFSSLSLGGGTAYVSTKAGVTAINGA